MTPPVPSPLNRRWRFHTICHAPKHSGTSRQTIPIQRRWMVPSTNVGGSVSPQRSRHYRFLSQALDCHGQLAFQADVKSVSKCGLGLAPTD
jgi:hypothetical protein